MKNTIRKSTHMQYAKRATLCSILVNLLLAFGKFICGSLFHAPALISDAIHSTADLSSTAIVLVSIVLAGKAPDKCHPYGHERLECIASILLSGILLATGCAIGYGGIRSIISGSYLTTTAPGLAALWMAAIAVMLKLFLFAYMRTIARRIGSTALRADAYHQISDALASLGALLGILAAILGFPIFDPLASVLIALFILRAAVSIFHEASIRLVDRSADEALENKIRTGAVSVSGVIDVLVIHTRMFGSRIYVELEILLTPSLPLSACADIAEAVRACVLSDCPEAKGCTVTLAPALEGQTSESS